MNPILETLAGPSGQFAYQIKPAEMLATALETHRGALNASGMGIGKTHMSLAAVLLTQRQPAIICPKPCVAGWQRAVAHFGVKPIFIGGYEEVKRGSRHFNRTGWHLPEGATIIFDEAHHCKGGEDTENGRMLGSAWQAGYPILMLSATIAENPAEMWSSGQVLGLHDGSPEGFKAWLVNMGCEWSIDRERWQFPARHRPRLKEIQAHIFEGSPPRGIRITPEALGDAFPPTDIRCVAVDLPDEIRDRINKAWKDCHDLEQRLRKQGAPSWKIVQLKRNTWAQAYELSQTAKAPYLIEKARAGVDAGYSVPIFCNYTDTRKEIMAGLHTRCGIFGGQKPLEREKHRLDFQQDRQRIIVCQIQSGGTGLDLHDVESDFERFAFILPCPKWMLIEQASGRVRRAGGGPSQQRIIYAAGTIESTMCKRHAERLANLKALVGEGMEITDD
ncbi:Superfamily II DNA or RNA helicase [Prosthecobacter debontii]|uniref:Superfamily II DNA or RNA helicase n=1 Tax=Prosthecobacter debontii TaxID=48467 RepID=A0A1T4X4Z1_9BACT|nr:hypothetical protein [Prosthecobacter debontii]SKA84662.1 Superfamily II DNA or RNA helicase [Prosthecobacter debontii]